MLVQPPVVAQQQFFSRVSLQGEGQTRLGRQPKEIDRSLQTGLGGHAFCLSSSKPCSKLSCSAKFVKVRLYAANTQQTPAEESSLSARMTFGKVI